MNKSKYILFKAEQNDIIQKLIKILNISKENNIFYYDDINDNVKQQLDGLKNDVRKYFVTTQWSCFSKPTKNFYRSFIKMLLKNSEMNVDYVSIFSSSNKKLRKGVKIMLN